MPTAGVIMKLGEGKGGLERGESGVGHQGSLLGTAPQFSRSFSYLEGPVTGECLLHSCQIYLYMCVCTTVIPYMAVPKQTHHGAHLLLLAIPNSQLLQTMQWVLTIACKHTQPVAAAS